MKLRFSVISIVLFFYLGCDKKNSLLPAEVAYNAGNVTRGSALIESLNELRDSRGNYPSPEYLVQNYPEIAFHLFQGFKIWGHEKGIGWLYLPEFNIRYNGKVLLLAAPLPVDEAGLDGRPVRGRLVFLTPNEPMHMPENEFINLLKSGNKVNLQSQP